VAEAPAAAVEHNHYPALSRKSEAAAVSGSNMFSGCNTWISSNDFLNRAFLPGDAALYRFFR